MVHLFSTFSVVPDYTYFIDIIIGHKMVAVSFLAYNFQRIGNLIRVSFSIDSGCQLLHVMTYSDCNCGFHTLIPKKLYNEMNIIYGRFLTIFLIYSLIYL
jgi:hypothetical protein